MRYRVVGCIGVLVTALGPAWAGCSPVRFTLEEADAGDAGGDVGARDSAKLEEDAAGETGTEAANDGGPGDAGADAAVENGKIIFVHASPDLGPVRFCFGLTAADAGTLTVSADPARPNLPHSGLAYPGMAAGAGGVAPDTIDLTNFVVTPFIIPADIIRGQTADGGPDGGAEANCVALIGRDGSGGVLQSSQYYRVAPIPAGTFLPGTTTLVALTGCRNAAAYTGDKAICGEDFNGTDGNLVAEAFKLDRTVVDPSKTGAQVFHASSAWDRYLSMTNHDTQVSQVVTITTPDAGAQLARLVPPPGITYRNTAPTQVTGFEATTFDPANRIVVTSFSATPDAGDAGDLGDAGTATANVLLSLPLPLGTVAFLSNGTGVSADSGAYFTTGQNYVFVLVGDPTPRDAGALQAPHVLAFPTNPPFPKPSEF